MLSRWKRSTDNEEDDRGLSGGGGGGGAVPAGCDLRVSDHPADAYRGGAVADGGGRGCRRGVRAGGERALGGVGVPGGGGGGVAGLLGDDVAGAAADGGGVVQHRGDAAAAGDHGGEPLGVGAAEHLERPAGHAGAAGHGVAAALCGEQPGSAGHAHPGVQDLGGRPGAASGAGVHGWVHPDPYIRDGGYADAGGGGLISAALRPLV